MRMTGDRFRHLHRAALFCAAAGLLLSTAPASAQAPAAPAAAATAVTPVSTAKPLWKELTKPQQLALEPLLGEWDKMDLPRKQKWLEIANRFASMKPDEQQRVHERMREWLKLTPEERRLARENYTLSKKIGKGEKTAQWEQYQALPEEEKRRLAAEAALKKAASPKTVPKAGAPAKPVVCPPGQVRNPNPAGPQCVGAAIVAPPSLPPPASVATPLPTTPPPGNPAVPNAK